MLGKNLRPTHYHPGVELRANLKPISHICHFFEVAFVWEWTKETINLPLGCRQGERGRAMSFLSVQVSRGARRARDWYSIAEQPAPAPHLARPEGRAALTHVCVVRERERSRE